jgi:glycosyltransferase involved in cell wall biosynthesis
MSPPLSLVIAVYNRPDVLRLLVAALARQTVRDAEVIFADDGSGEEVARVIADAKASLPFAVQHLWHEDRGWRKNVMLNAAVRTARSDYLVFIDADCLPHARFLEDHLRARAQRTVLCGRRVEMSRRWSEHLTLERVASGAFEHLGADVWLDGVRGRALRVEDGLRLPVPMARLLHGRRGGLLGSNFSLHRDDLARINGFDELYDGPGCGEDSDIEFRLRLDGVRMQALRHSAIQYHVWHPRTQPAERCLLRFATVQRERLVRCTHGLEHASMEVAA